MSVPEIQPDARSPRRWYQYRLRTLLALVFLVSVGFKAFTAIREQMELADRMDATRSAFRYVWISLLNHEDLFGHLPCAVRRETIGGRIKLGIPNGTGRPLYSWRGELSAFTRCGYPGYILNPSEPWNSQANQKNADGSPYCYRGQRPGEATVSHEANMLGICGPRTAFGCEGEQPRSLKDLGQNTILAVETRHPGVDWAEPGDFDIRNMPHTINAADGRGISSRYPGGFHVLFSDGKMWFLSEKIPFETLAKFFTIEEANRTDRENVLGEFILSRYPRE